MVVKHCAANKAVRLAERVGQVAKGYLTLRQQRANPAILSAQVPGSLLQTDTNLFDFQGKKTIAKRISAEPNQPTSWPNGDLSLTIARVSKPLL